MISRGTVVEFKKDNKNLVAVCLDCKSDKVRLLCANKEITLPLDKVLFTSEYTLDIKVPREELVKSIKEINEEREALKSFIPLKDLWDLLIDEGGNYTAQEIAELNFGKNFTSNQMAAVYRALNEDTIFFKSKKSAFYPNSHANVEQILQMIRIEQEKEERNKKIITWIKQIWKGEEVTVLNSDIESFISKLKHVAVHKTESHHYKTVSDLLEKSEISAHNSPFRLLVKSGIWDEDENLDIYQYQIPTEFSQSILEETQKIFKYHNLNTGEKIDLTEIDTFTIDNNTTEDMDDALSIEKIATGYKVGIHITDVAEYIEPYMVIDNEARARYTSIYLPEKKINMFPPVLSNNLFSLIKGEIRPAISVLIDFDNNFNMKNYKIKETIIKVKERLTYEEVDNLIETNQNFSILHNISEKLRERRKAGGAKIFYMPELEIKVNENKEITLEIYDRETPSHKLISEMMIIANELTARYCKENSIPIIYRNQPALDENCQITDNYDPVMFFKQRKYFKKSEASTDPEHHYGLGVECYTQMTSPIRRYSDLIIHRQLKSFLRNIPYVYNNQEINDIIMISEQILESANIITKNRKRYWLLKYLKNRTGQTIEAIVLQNLNDRIVIILKKYFLELTCMFTNEVYKVSPGDEIQVKIETINPREDIIKVKG